MTGRSQTLQRSSSSIFDWRELQRLVLRHTGKNVPERAFGRARTQETYRSNYRTRVKPVLSPLTVAQVAVTRDLVADQLAVSMRNLSIGTRRMTRMIILGTLDEAVKAGKIPGTALPESSCSTTAPALGRTSCSPSTHR